MPGTAVIERASYAADGMGGQRETWAAVGTVDCRLMIQASRQGQEFVTGEQETSLTRWWATMPIGTDVLAQDRLLVASRNFEVVAVNNDEDYWSAVRCECIAFNEENRT